MMKTINEMSIPGAGVEISILQRRTAQRLKLKLHFAVLWICCKATSGRIKWDLHLWPKKSRAQHFLNIFKTMTRETRSAWQIFYSQRECSELFRVFLSFGSMWEVPVMMRAQYLSHGAWIQFLLDKNKLRFCFSQVVGFDVRIPNM